MTGPGTDREDGWARRRARVARHIERTALELLAREGPQNLTAEQIAAASGISVRTYFRYFPSRDAALTALARRLNDTTCRRVAARPTGESVLDAFTAAVRDGIDPEDEELILLWGQAVRRGFQPTADPDGGMVAAYAEVIAARLGIDVADVRVQVFAAATAGVMWSTFVRWIEGDGAHPLPKLMEEAFDALADLDRATGRPTARLGRDAGSTESGSTKFSSIAAMQPSEVESRLAITDLVARYTRAGDTGREEQFAELFADDGVFEVNGGRSGCGHEEIATLMNDVKRAFAKAPPSFFPARHQVSSLTIDFDDADHATGRSYFLLVCGWGPDHWGVYRDRYERRGDRWWFTYRRAVMEGALPHSPMAFLLGNGKWPAE
jgi:AcrR family transcriptional regulator